MTLPPVVHAQIDNRGDLRNTGGLAESLVWPAGVRTDSIKMIYGPDPDGCEGALGPIMRPTLAEMVLPQRLERLVANIPAMADLFVPADFAGMIEVDFEYSWYAGPWHTEQAENVALAALWPTYTRAELYGKLIDAVVPAVRRARPRAADVLWFGAASPNPNTTDSPPAVEDLLRMAKRDGACWAGKVTPVATLYTADTPSPAVSRESGRSLVSAAVTRAFGRAGPRYAEFNARCPAPDGMPTGRFLTEAEVAETLAHMDAYGWRNRIVWHALADAADRDATQEWINGPFARALAATAPDASPTNPSPPAA